MAVISKNIPLFCTYLKKNNIYAFTLLSSFEGTLVKVASDRQPNKVTLSTIRLLLEVGAVPKKLRWKQPAPPHSTRDGRNRKRFTTIRLIDLFHNFIV